MRELLLAGMLLIAAGSLLVAGAKKVSARAELRVESVTADVRDSVPEPRQKPQRRVRVLGHGFKRVNSTAYCLRGRMANGEQVHDGAVAMNGVPFGTRFKVVSGPLAGRIFTVKDRIGHGSMFDVWMGSCADALSYGRRSIQIQRDG